MEEFCGGSGAESAGGICGNCGKGRPLELDTLGFEYETTADEIQSPKEKLTSHVTKFLCPRYDKFADAPSQTESELFTGERDDGQVEVESCGWEVEIFVDRKPEVLTTDKFDLRTLNDGTLWINDYVIQPDSDLGCGTFCTFHFATCTRDHGYYAIKAMSKRRAKKSSMLFRNSGNPFINIERETGILKQLNHPNIVKLFEIMDYDDEDMIYFVFEYMDRGCILTLPTDFPLKESLALRYFHDTLFGVEYLHSKSIIHRDIKPENLLLNSFGRVKLIDFGLSICLEHGIDTTRLPYGSPSFTAPECVNEDMTEGYSAKAMEVWALGVTLFSLLFGNVPFFHENLFELYRMIQEEKLVIPIKFHISLDARSLLKHVLEKDLNKRCKLQDILASPLFSSRNSKHFIPDRCKTCQYYHPVECHNSVKA